MFRIMFSDGYSLHAFGDELEVVRYPPVPYEKAAVKI